MFCGAAHVLSLQCVATEYCDMVLGIWILHIQCGELFFRLFIRSTQIIFFFFVSTRAEQVAIFPLPRTVATPVLYMFISGWERYTCPFIYSYVGSFFSGRHSSAPTSVDTC